MLDLGFRDNRIRKAYRKSAFHCIMESDLLDIIKEFCCFNISNITAQAPDKLLCNFLVNNTIDKPYLLRYMLVENHPADSSKHYGILFKLRFKPDRLFGIWLNNGIKYTQWIKFLIDLIGILYKYLSMKTNSLFIESDENIFRTVKYLTFTYIANA